MPCCSDVHAWACLGRILHEPLSVRSGVPFSCISCASIHWTWDSAGFTYGTSCTDVGDGDAFVAMTSWRLFMCSCG